MMSTPPSSSADGLRDALNAMTPNPTELLAFLPAASSPSTSSIDVDDSNTPPTNTKEVPLNNKPAADPHTKITPSFETKTTTINQTTKQPSPPRPTATTINPSTTTTTTAFKNNLSDADLLRSIQHDVILKWPENKGASPPSAQQPPAQPPKRQTKQAMNKKLGANDVVLPNPLPRPVGDDVEDDEVMRQYREQGMTADLIARKKLKMGAPKHLWIAEEDIVLASGVAQLGEKCWSEIATLLPGRVGKQCRDRWRNHLCPMVKKGSWTDHEDRLLFYHHQKLGNMWAEIAKQIPGRTDLSVKNRFYSFLRKIGRQMARAAKERHAFNQQAVFRYLRSPKNEPGLADVSPECWAVDQANGGFSAALFAAKQAAADKAAGIVPSSSAASSEATDTTTTTTTNKETGVTSTGMVPGIALPMEEVTPELAYAYDKVLGGIAKQPPEPLPTFTGPFNANIMDRGGSHTPLGKAAAKAALDAGQLAAKVKEKKRKASNASYAAAARKKKAALAAAVAGAAASAADGVSGVAALAATGPGNVVKRGGQRAGAGGVKKKATTYLYDRKTNKKTTTKKTTTKKTTTKKTTTKKKSKKPKGLTVKTDGVAGPSGGVVGGQGALGMLTSLLAAGTEDAALVTAIAGLTEMATPNSRAAQRKRTASAAALAVAAAAAGNNKNKRKKRSKRTVTEVAAAALAMKKAKRAKAGGSAAVGPSASTAAGSSAANNNGVGGIKQAVDSAADLLLGLAQPSLSPHSSPSPTSSPHMGLADLLSPLPVAVEGAATPTSKTNDSKTPSPLRSANSDVVHDTTTGTKRKFADVHVIVPPNHKFVNGGETPSNTTNNKPRRVNVGSHVLDVNTMFSPVGHVNGNGSIGNGNGSIGVGTKATPKNVGGSNNSAAAGEISKRVFASPISSGGGGAGNMSGKPGAAVVGAPAAGLTQ